MISSSSTYPLETNVPDISITSLRHYKYVHLLLCILTVNCVNVRECIIYMNDSNMYRAYTCSRDMVGQSLVDVSYSRIIWGNYSLSQSINFDYVLEFKQNTDLYNVMPLQCTVFMYSTLHCIYTCVYVYTHTCLNISFCLC